MTSPKPIAVTYIAPENYTGPEPQPFTIVGEEPGDGGTPDVAAEDITDATATGVAVLTAEDAEAARTAIGAGTGSSDLEIGTSGSTAAAGNHTHSFGDLGGSVADASGSNLQAILEDLASRVEALEE